MDSQDSVLCSQEPTPYSAPGTSSKIQFRQRNTLAYRVLPATSNGAPTLKPNHSRRWHEESRSSTLLRTDPAIPDTSPLQHKLRVGMSTANSKFRMSQPRRLLLP
jgi:hypothetical protein